MFVVHGDTHKGLPVRSQRIMPIAATQPMQPTYNEPHSFPVPLQKVIAKMTTTSLVRETVLLNPATLYAPGGRPTIIIVGSKAMPYQYNA